MYVDLHCHSHFSDGAHSPDYLVRRAFEKGISHLALTDHDCIEGVEELLSRLPQGEAHAESANALRLIAGVELSCDWNGLEIHVVGLLEDTRQEALQALLLRQQWERRARAAAIADKLKNINIVGLETYLTTLPAISVTRSHIADYLVMKGHCKSHQKAFKTHLSRRGKAYVAANWCTLEEAISAILAAGGIAVLAHPSRYPLTRSKLGRLLHDFREAGGEAMEVSYGNLDTTAKKRLLELADEYALYHSCGSDFHTDQAQWTALGKFPRIEPSVTKNTIWEHPRWHSCVAAGRAIPLTEA